MKIVISHGSFGKPHENWIPWLEEKLDEMGVEYLTPTFPTPKHQAYSDWSRVLDMYREFGCFDENTIFVGHSCGAIFLARYIVDNGISCKGYISASGYNNFYNNDELMDGLNGSFYFDNAELKKISELVKKRIAFRSDNDPFIPQEKLCEYVSLISAEEIVIKNGGHLNASAGLKTFEPLLEKIKEIIKN